MEKENKVNILIVEDEAIVAMDLAASLAKEGYRITGIADNADDAETLYRQEKPDLALVDINIIGATDGIVLVEKLMSICEIPIIYLTALSDASTLSRMKQTRPAAYLTKPYNMRNVNIAIDLAISNFAMAQPIKTTQQLPAAQMRMIKDDEPQPEAAVDKEQILLMNDYLFIKQNYRFVKVVLSDILYAEAENNYIHLVTADKKYTVRMSLSQMAEKINYSQFIRIHRSYVVNIGAISNFTDSELQVGKHTLPIGRNYHDSFIRQFKFK